MSAGLAMRRALFALTLVPYGFLVTGLARAIHLQIAHLPVAHCNAFCKPDSGHGEQPKDSPRKPPPSGDCPTCHQLTTGTSAVVQAPTTVPAHAAPGLAELTVPERAPYLQDQLSPSGPRGPPLLAA